MNYLIFGQGKGKTTHLLDLANDSLESGLIFVETKKSNFLNTIPSNRINDTIVVDISDAEHPIAWNPLEQATNPYTAAVKLKDTISALWGYGTLSTPILDRMLYTSLFVIISHKRTLLDLGTFLRKKPFRDNLLKDIKDTFIKDQWDFWHSFSDKEYRQLIASTENKAGEFSEDPRIRNILGQPSKLWLEPAIKEKKIVYIYAPFHLLGEKAKTFVSLFLGQLATIPVYDFPIFIDDAYKFDSEILHHLYSERDNITIVYNYLDQVSSKMNHAAFGNADELFIYRTGIHDSNEVHKALPHNNLVERTHKLTDFNYYTVEGLRPKIYATPDSPPLHHHAAKVAAQSRRRYTRSRSKAEAHIEEGKHESQHRTRRKKARHAFQNDVVWGEAESGL